MAVKIERTYGRLAFRSSTPQRKSAWVISDVEPHVAIRLKQIFPRIPKTSTGPFDLPSDPMHAADLCWFTDRYPLAISDADGRRLNRDRRRYEQTQAEMERILLPSYQPPPIIGLKPGQSLRRYQCQAIDLLHHRGSLLLGDEGGLGKTYTAAGFLCTHIDSLPAAVVCDSHMQRQWEEKVTGFTHLRVHVVDKARPYDLPPADVYIYRLSQLAGWIDIFKKGIFTTVIYDELQGLRTGTATDKGTAAQVLSSQAKYRFGLTATPIYNYGTEMWNVMQFIDELVLGAYTDFHREWCSHTGHIDDPKALGTYLREQHAMLRRLKSDVGLELPKVSRIVEHVDYDAKTVQSIEDLARQLAIKATRGTFIERGQAARELDLMVRKATGVAKAKAVARFVRLLVEAGEPVVLTGWHRDVYDIWLEDLQDLRPAMHTGSETAAKKCKEVDRFMSGDTDVLIISLRSGAGLDGLQHRASVVVFGELDWSPGIHEQIIWRVDRDGQSKPVTIFFLVTEAGSDPDLMDVLGIKASEARQIVDPHLGVRTTDNDTTNLQRLVQRYLAKVAAKAGHETPQPQCQQ